MKYSIVIPTYNHCEKYLKPCVDSIIKHTDMSQVELIISANGCTDNTRAYLDYLRTAIPNLEIVWSNEPLGFAQAINKGIRICFGDKIVLLNNDTVILGPNWLERLDQGDIGAVLTQHSDITQSRFGVFFCAMISPKVFQTIGMLNEEYRVGGCEDIEFCHKAQLHGFELVDVGYQGDFPIYHAAEGTMHDPQLVKDWDNSFLINQLKLAKKYNLDWYRWRLSNNYERAVFLKGDQVFPRETQRYEWAAKNLLGHSVLEIGCSTGYGVQFFPQSVSYFGLDYDPMIVQIAKEQYWSPNALFDYADINTYPIEGYFDTIVAFEVIEHLDNGLEIVEKLKQHCKRLLITVPHNEPKGFWGEHHKLHGLTEKDFPGFKFTYINFHGGISDTMVPVDNHNPSNLMICRWDNE
jgi:glycosyltransferase involved in cell wall biosynthesis